MSRNGSPLDRIRVVTAVGAALVLASAIGAPASAASSTARGPSTTTDSYVLPVADGIHITSLLTVDDGAASNGYQMVGVPDGLGMIRQGANLVLYSNQELADSPSVQGITRRHGQAAAFVSRWVIDPATLRFKEGSDLINPGVQYWDYPSASYVTSGARYADSTFQDLTLGRFCSGTLSDPGVFYDESTKTGYQGQIYFANEEDGDNGRAFGVTKDGDAAALPRLGLFSWENTKPAANESGTTLIIGDEDGPTDGSQLWVYVGHKQDSGPPVAKAGLTNGDDHILDADNQAVATDAQWRTTYGQGVGARVHLVDNDWNATGAVQNSTAKTDGLNLNRIEDGHWDPSNPNDFYFLTTQGGVVTGSGLNGGDTGGLWRLRWDDIEDPDAGATLTLLLDGTQAPTNETATTDDDVPLNKPDNMTIDQRGNLLIQEDPGNNNHIARIVAYRISDGALAEVGAFDPALFGPGATQDPNKLTIDEESSGIIDTEDFLGAGTFVFDAQVHTAKGLPAGTGPGTVQEFVERGQYLMLKVDDWSTVYARD
jgi:Alkaline phosphatase PhoX